MRSSLSLLAILFISSLCISASAQTTAPPGSPPAEDVELYVQKCSSCHSVGDGDRVGPDLSGVHSRRDSAWLRTMIQMPSKLLDSDGDARSMVTKYKGVRMPDLGLSDEQVDVLAKLITFCSENKCELKGKLTPVTKATPEDAALGVALFLGTKPFAKGGPACVSCHTIDGIGGAVQGGTLAKNLTHSFAVLGDEALDAALKNPNFALMNKVYGDAPLNSAETFALRAALYDANRGALPGGGQRINVVLLAVLIALLALAGLNAAWSRRRRQGIRHSLVNKEQEV